jgi:hypothetical protein
MFNAEFYDDLRGRTTALLIEVEHTLRPCQIAAIGELIDHDEPGVAVEMITAMLAEVGARITADQAAQVERLVQEMGLDESASRQARTMVQRA